MKTNHVPAGRYRWLILCIGVVAQMTFAIGFAGIPASAVIMRADYHYSLGNLGFVLGCMGLGVAISETTWGVLTDKLGDKKVLISGLVLTGVTFLGMYVGYVPKGSVLPSYLSVGMVLVIAGAVGGSINSSSGRAVMSWFQENEQGFAMSIRQTAIPAGSAIGTLLVPFLSSAFGFGSAFLTLATINFLVSIVVFIWLVERKMSHNTPVTTSMEVKSPFKRMAVWKIAMAGATLSFPQMSILTFAAVFLSDQQHFHLITISLINFCINLGGGCLRVITGRLSDRHQNRRQVIRMIAIIAGLASLLLGLAANKNAFVVVPLLLIAGLAGNAWHGIGYSEIAATAGMRYAGRALGMMGTTVFAVSFIIPYIIPFVLRFTSWTGVWIVVGVASLIAFPMMRQEKQSPRKARLG